jgi:6-phosphofructokinase 2
VAVSEAGAWWARPELPAALARDAAQGSAVGAGDAFLAALLLAESEPTPEALRRGVAAGTAVLLGRGQDLVTREDTERVLLHVVVDTQDP